MVKKHVEGSYIVINGNIHSSTRPIIKGTRITVDDIMGYTASGWSADKLAHELNIPKAAILEALVFASKIAKEVSVIG